MLVEYLAGILAQLENRSFFLGVDVFNSGLESLKIKVSSAFKEVYPDISDKELSRMLGNIRGLNSRPLKWKLQRLAARLKVDLTEEEIGNFVELRNHLAHESKFPDNAKSKENYQQMQHFLDRIILRLFGYSGPYYDFEHQERRQI